MENPELPLFAPPAQVPVAWESSLDIPRPLKTEPHISSNVRGMEGLNLPSEGNAAAPFLASLLCISSPGSWDMMIPGHDDTACTPYPTLGRDQV
jgi:hypothetical protein